MPKTKIEDVEINFGKHKNSTLGEILADDPGYLDWLRGIKIDRADLAQAVAEMNEKYAAEIERALR